MPRQVLTVEELQAEMQRRIDASDYLDGDCKECGAPGIYFLQEPDENGCNWSPNVYRGPRECAPMIRRIVEEVQRLYNVRR